MKCPHCSVEVHPAWSETDLNSGAPIGLILGRPKPAPLSGPKSVLRAAATTSGSPVQGSPSDRLPTFFKAVHMECPACRKAIIQLQMACYGGAGTPTFPPYLIYPPNGASRQASMEVPAELSADFAEAAAVFTISAQASAALSRRCLQALLRAQGFMQRDLAPQIDALLASKTLPSGLAENVDAIRNIGNFAAHPLKDTNSGAVLPVEPHEAEWNLDVLEGLFDFFYVAPAKDAARRAALNAKMAAAGKPPMK